MAGDIGIRDRRNYDPRMETRPIQSVGLGGDGDEISALREVEEAFGVRLDYADADNWHCAGDVYAALLRALPAGEADQPGVWDRFAEALCRETGISPSAICPESELLVESGIWVSVTNGSTLFWSAIALAAAIGVGWMLL